MVLSIQSLMQPSKKIMMVLLFYGHMLSIIPIQESDLILKLLFQVEQQLLLLVAQKLMAVFQLEVIIITTLI